MVKTIVKKTLAIAMCMAVALPVSVMPADFCVNAAPSRYAWLYTDSYITAGTRSDGGATSTHDIYRENGGDLSGEPDGVTYDSATNTMTLDNVNDDAMTFDIYNMGKDFKIKVVGKCEIASIYVSGRQEDAACLTFTGDGSLTMNKSKKGAEKTIWINNYDYNIGEGVLNIDKDVNLNLYPGQGGLYSTVTVSYTRAATKDKAIAVAGNIDGNADILQDDEPEYGKVTLNRLSLGSKGTVPVYKNKDDDLYYYCKLIKGNENVPNQYNYFPIILSSEYANGPIVVRQTGELIREDLFESKFEKCTAKPADLDESITASVNEDGQLCIECYTLDSVCDFTPCSKDGKRHIGYVRPDSGEDENGNHYIDWYWTFYKDEWLTTDTTKGRFYDDKLGIIFTTDDNYCEENDVQDVNNHNKFNMEYVNGSEYYTIDKTLKTENGSAYLQYKTLQDAGYTLEETDHFYTYTLKDPLIVRHKTHTWGEGVVTKEETETAEGVMTYTCSGCGDTKTEEIPKLEAKPDTTESPQTTETPATTEAPATTETPANTEVPKTETPAVTAGTTATDDSGATYTVTESTDGKVEVEYTASDNSKAKKVTIPSTVTVNGVTATVTSIADNAFSGNKTVTSVTIPATVEEIGDNAFKNCTKLKKVTLPASVEEVGKNAFSGCSSLTTVTVKGSALTTIDQGAFKNCKSLKTVTLSKNVTTIGKEAFAGDKKLKTVTIKSTKLKSVGKNAFKGVPKNTTIKVPKKQKKAYTKLLKKAGFKGKIK